MEFKTEGGFQYTETIGGGPPIILLHGLFGGAGNFECFVRDFGAHYNLVVLRLPIFALPQEKVSVPGLVEFLSEFVAFKKYDEFHLVGNSLGGHIALLFTLDQAGPVISLTLTGSSGLYESGLGTSFLKLKDKEFVREKIQNVFFDRAGATDELVDEVFAVVNDHHKAARLVALARSALRQNLSHRLGQVNCPTLLIWGEQDRITPRFVGEQFHRLIKDSRLLLIDKCGHAPMMEQPEQFTRHFENFLQEIARLGGSHGYNRARGFVRGVATPVPGVPAHRTASIHAPDTGVATTLLKPL
jgi:pimeloyl-ACP methyl ester carboxylesterase